MPAFYSATVNIAQNEDWIVPFDYGTATTNGIEAIDLTGSVLMLQIRQTPGDHEALVAVSSPTDGIVISAPATNGAFQITITRAQLALLSPDVAYVTDLVRILPSGNREIIFEGAVTVEEGVTR